MQLKFNPEMKITNSPLVDTDNYYKLHQYYILADLGMLYSSFTYFGHRQKSPEYRSVLLVTAGICNGVCNHLFGTYTVE